MRKLFQIVFTVLTGLVLLDYVYLVLFTGSTDFSIDGSSGYNDLVTSCVLFGGMFLCIAAAFVMQLLLLLKRI